MRTTTSTRVVAAGTAALEAKVAELTLTLEISQKGTDTILERAVAAEAEVKDLLASIEKGSAGSKATESPAKMPESSAILQLKVSKVLAAPPNPPSSWFSWYGLLQRAGHSCYIKVATRPRSSDHCNI